MVHVYSYELLVNCPCVSCPGMRYVVDAGRSKQKLQMSDSGAVARYHVDWISKASAEQRAGRAGRTGPGHCYRWVNTQAYPMKKMNHLQKQWGGFCIAAPATAMHTYIHT